MIHPIPVTKWFGLIAILAGLYGAVHPPGAAAAGGVQWYAAPGGSPSGDGSAANPWDLQTALNQPRAVKPGDTIWLRGGTYTGAFTSKLNGTAGNPIVVRQYPGERAIIDRAGRKLVPPALEISGSWTWYWGFEVMNSETNRSIDTAGSNPDNGRATGVNLLGKNLKLINILIHDNGTGLGLPPQAEGAEVYGTLIYHNGWLAPDRGHGHGIYAQNHTGTKYLTDNILFSGFNHGLHAYGSGDGAYVDNFDVQGNVSFNSGILQGEYERNFLIGNGITCANNNVAGNYAYFPASTNVQSFNLGYLRGCQEPVVTNNYFVGNVTLANNKNLQLADNTVVGTISFDYQNTPGNSLGSYPGNTQMARNSPPSGTKIFIRPNKYEPGRAHVIVYNWDRKDSVDVDLSGVLHSGDAYEIRDVQNFAGPPLLTGTYTGGAVKIPMTSAAVMPPVGFAAPRHTDKEFGVFVVLPAARIAPDSTPPAIAGVAATSVTCVSAVIAWTTSKLSDGQVQYSAPLGSPTLSSRDAVWTTSHVEKLSDLAPDTEYSYQVRSSDPSGNVAVSPVFTFTTPDLSANQAPAVNAGPDLAIAYPAFASLGGSVADDGLPAGELNAAWKQLSGPGAVRFTDASSPVTTATFSAPGIYVLRLTASDGDFSSSADVTVAANDAGPDSPPAVRVNCGGPSYADDQGQVWNEDNGFQGGDVYAAVGGIAGTGAPVLYQTVRYGAHSYHFDLADGAYIVRLKFAETYFDAAGKRIFNAVVNGQTVLANFDIFAEAGASMTACDRQFDVTVAGGGIDIQFSPVLENPCISAIEILPPNPVAPATPADTVQRAPAHRRR